MKLVKWLAGLMLTAALWILLVPAQAADSSAVKQKITVGTTSGADVEILEEVKLLAEKQGLEVTIIEFSDYVRPNLALAQKEIDVNAFQHLPYLRDFCAERSLRLTAIGNTYVSPLGFFSKKIKNMESLRERDTVAIPNDPTNGGRALLLLQKAGLIELRKDAGLIATPQDVILNKLKLRITEVDAAQTPRALDDVTLAAINNTFAIPAGLNPLTDAIYLEDKESPYVNVIVCRAGEEKNPVYKKFVEIYQSPEVARFILERFKGATVPAFDY